MYKQQLNSFFFTCPPSFSDLPTALKTAFLHDDKDESNICFLWLPFLSFSLLSFLFSLAWHGFLHGLLPCY